MVIGQLHCARHWSRYLYCYLICLPLASYEEAITIPIL